MRNNNSDKINNRPYKILQKKKKERFESFDATLFAVYVRNATFEPAQFVRSGSG